MKECVLEKTATGWHKNSLRRSVENNCVELEKRLLLVIYDTTTKKILRGWEKKLMESLIHNIQTEFLYFNFLGTGKSLNFIATM